jgi:hypothetical protein
LSGRDNTDFAAEIPRELQRADELLTQYGRWATSYGSRKGAPTLDRMFIREADRKESLEAYQRRRAHVPGEMLMSTPDALNVQRALAKVPDRENIVLRILYIPRRQPVHVQLAALRITPSLCRIRHESGLRMFKHLHDVVSLASRVPCI